MHDIKVGDIVEVKIDSKNAHVFGDDWAETFGVVHHIGEVGVVTETYVGDAGPWAGVNFMEGTTWIRQAWLKRLRRPRA